MRRTAALLATAALLLAACGDDDAETATGTAAETTPDEPSDTQTTEAVDATDAPGTTAAPGELPGERIELFPYEDAALAVVGVAADDTLRVRAAPDPAAEVLAELQPLADGFRATGHNRQLAADAIWSEVDTGEVRGWVNTVFIAQLGATDEATARLYPSPADRPLADTLVALAEAVAATVGESDGAGPRVVVVDGPRTGDLGEITVDVLGFPDDSVLGQRLHVFAEEEGGGAFRLRTVESTVLCRRGVSEGLCV